MSASTTKARRREEAAVAKRRAEYEKRCAEADAEAAALGLSPMDRLVRAYARQAEYMKTHPPAPRDWRPLIQKGRAAAGRPPFTERPIDPNVVGLKVSRAAHRAKIAVEDGGQRGAPRPIVDQAAAASDAARAAASNLNAADFLANTADAEAAHDAADACDVERGAPGSVWAALAAGRAAMSARASAAAWAAVMAAAARAAHCAAAADAAAGRVKVAADAAEASPLSRADMSWAAGAAVHARRAADAADRAGINALAAEREAVEADADGRPYILLGRARADRKSAREYAARARAAADAAAVSPGVRAALGMAPAASAIDLYEEACVAARRAAESLLAADADAVRAAHPLPKLPAGAAAIAKRARQGPNPKAQSPAAAGAAPSRAPSGWYDHVAGVEHVVLVEGGGAAPPPGEDDEDPESGYAYFCQGIREGKFAGLVAGDWRPPGNGAAYETCGKYVRVKQCSHADHAGLGVPFDSGRAVENSCHRIDCPTCFETAFKRKAADDRAIGRMFSYIALRQSGLWEGGSKKWLPSHAVLSAPGHMYEVLKTAAGVKAARAFIRRRLAAMGIEAAIAIFHPWRFDKKNGGAPEYSPHFHLLLCGWTEPAVVKDLYERDGWIYKRIRGITTLEHLRQAMLYVLSHAGVATMPSGRAADVVRYFGNLGTRVFGSAMVHEAQAEVPEAIGKILQKLSHGKYPLLPPPVMSLAPDAEPPEFVPIMDTRIIAPADKIVAGPAGRKFAVAEFGTMADVAGGRTDAFEVACHADLDRFLRRAGRQAAKDNPAYRPINQTDVVKVRVNGASIDTVPTSAILRAQGKGVVHAKGGDLKTVHLPLTCPRTLVIRVRYAPAGLAAAGGGGPVDVTLDPTKTPATRYVVIYLSPSLSNLCLICRRPLSVGVVDVPSGGRLAVHMWPDGQTILVPRDRLKSFNPEEHAGLPIYSRDTGHASVDWRVLAEPPHIAAYPTHVRAAVRRRVEESVVAAELAQNTGRRPDREVIIAEINARRARARARSGGMADVDDRL